MEFYVPVAEMQSAIVYLRPVLNRGSEEISNLLLIETEENSVLFSATNNVTSVKVRVEALIKKQGQILTPAVRLLNYLQTFSVWNGRSGTKNFRFMIKNDKFSVASDTKYESGVDSKRMFDHRYLNVHHFPSLSEFEGDPDFALNVWDMRNIIRNILKAVNPDESRAALSGIFMTLGDNKLTLVGTDGYRIVEFQEGFPFDGKDQQCVLDHAFVSSLLSVFKDMGMVDFKVGSREILAKKDNVVLIGRLINEDYPNYGAYFERSEQEIKLPRMEFLDNLASTLPALNIEDYHRLVLKFEPDNRIMMLADGFQNEYILGQTHDFTEEIHMDGTKLNDCIEALQGSELLVKFADEDAPLIFESPDDPCVRSLLVLLRSD